MSKMGFSAQISAAKKWDVMHVPGNRPGMWDEASPCSVRFEHRFFVFLWSCSALVLARGAELKIGVGLCTGWDVVHPIPPWSPLLLSAQIKLQSLT